MGPVSRPAPSRIDFSSVLPNTHFAPATRGAPLQVRAPLPSARLVSNRTAHDESWRRIWTQQPAAGFYGRGAPDCIPEDSAIGRARIAIKVALRPPANATAALRGPITSDWRPRVPGRRQYA